MKVNKLLAFLGDSGYKSKAIRYIYVYLIALAILLWNLLSYREFPDTVSYIKAADRLMQGQWDVFRTPVYPALIAFGKLILGESWRYFVLFLQVACFFVSAVALQRVTLRLCKSLKVTFWITAWYLIAMSLSSFPVFILTDGLSTSGMVFMLWLLLRVYPKPPAVGDMVGTSLLLLILIFLRPFFVYMIPVLIIYYTGAFLVDRKRFKRQYIIGLLGCVIVVGCVQMYRSVMHREFGITSISRVTAVNNYFPVRESLPPNPALASNPKMKACIESFSDSLRDYNTILKEFKALKEVCTDAEFENYVNQQIASNRLLILKSIILRTINYALPAPYFPIMSYSPSILTQMLDNLCLPTIMTYFLFVMIYAVGWLKVWRHNRQIPLASLLLIMTSAGATCAAIIGAQGEWSRLSMPGFPAFLVMLAIALSIVSVSLRRYYVVK